MDQQGQASAGGTVRKVTETIVPSEGGTKLPGKPFVVGHTIQHGLGTRDVIVQCYSDIDGQAISVDISRPDEHSVELSFTEAFSEPVRVVITG